MKRIMIFLLISILIIGLYKYIQLPDYLVHNSFVFTNQDNKEVELHVIVYKYWGIDEMLKDIVEEHNMINGTPDSLEVNLYYNRKSEPFKTVIYE